MSNSTWKSLARIWEWLNAVNFRRRRAAERQRNMLAGVVVVVLVDLAIALFIR